MHIPFNPSSRALLGLAALSLSVSLSAGCLWTDFDDITDSAAVRVYEAPESYNKSRYGSVLTTLNLGSGADAHSHVVASAGPDTPVVFEGIWDNNGLGGDSSLRCRDKSKCGKGASVGATLIPVEFWATESTTPKSGCVIAPAVGNAYVLCQSDPDGTENYPLDISGVVEPKTNIFFGGAGLPANYALGVALISAHARLASTGEPRNGTIYYQPDRSGELAVPPLRRFDVIDPRTKQPFASGGVEAGDYGYRVAVQPGTGSSVLVAISQPSHNRVIVARYDPDIEVPSEITSEPAQVSARIQTLACIKSPDASLVGFGKVLTMGDVNNDQRPELFVGIDPMDRKNGDKQRLYMYRGTGMPTFDAAADQCPLWDSDPVQVGCIGGIRGVGCEATAFGASVALGDVNGDSYNDVIVGAPLADVQGERDAGVVWLIPGGPDDDKGGLDFDGMQNLYAAGQEAGEQLGAAVGAVRTRNRDEPVAGAPGTDRVYVFMCSKLESESTKSFCLPE